jgi:SAM-dependent methyltransferase
MIEHGNGHQALSIADVRSLPLKDIFFDMVICREFVEHIPEDRLAVREVIRALKPGNTLVLSVLKYLPEPICWALSDDYTNANQGHVRIYKMKELIALLETEGAKTWATQQAHSLDTLYWWLKCLVGQPRGMIPLWSTCITSSWPGMSCSNRGLLNFLKIFSTRSLE